MSILKRSVLFFATVCCAACLGGCGPRAGIYHDPNMDFGSIHSVAVMPLANYSSDRMAEERVTDDLMDSLLASGAIYVLPIGEVLHGVMVTGVNNPLAPTVAEVKSFCKLEKVDAVITGEIKEYGTVRQSGTQANVISVSLQMLEGQTGRVVWSASSTKGGVNIFDRLFGNDAGPMDTITQKAVNDLIKKLFM